MCSVALSLLISLVVLTCMLSVVWSGMNFKDYEELAITVKLTFLKGERQS